MIPALRLALGTLTIAPTGAVDVTPTIARRAMIMAPVAVLPLAVLAGGVTWAGWVLGLPPLLRGVAVVAVLAWGTRALHLDGLADTADGLGSGWDRERALAVMRRGDVGPFGVVTLALVLLTQVVAIGELSHDPWGALVVALTVCVSRCAVPTVCVRGWPAARADGLGAAVADTVPRPTVVLLWVMGLLIMAAAAPATASWLIMLAVPVAAGVVVLLGRTCVRRFGGVTGDVIGACVEAALTALLIVALLIMTQVGR